MIGRCVPASVFPDARIFAASEAWLGGDAARAIRVIDTLRADGDGPQLVVWALADDLHALAAVHAMTARGTPMASALRTIRMWGRRQAALERAASRVRTQDVPRWLARLATIDALSKGIGTGDAWEALQRLALDIAGPQRRTAALDSPR